MSHHSSTIKNDLYYAIDGPSTPLVSNSFSPLSPQPTNLSKSAKRRERRKQRKPVTTTNADVAAVTHLPVKKYYPNLRTYIRIDCVESVKESSDESVRSGEMEVAGGEMEVAGGVMAEVEGEGGLMKKAARGNGTGA